MRKRNFTEEEVVEKVTTETTEESTPDSHEQFVNILVDMGLSAEQAEAVHQMATDLIEAGEGETETEVKEETTEKVEASRQARRKRALARSKARRNRRSRPERSRSFSRERRETPNREARMLSRLRRQNIELRKQLREFGASPATKPVRNAPQGVKEDEGTNPLSGATSQAFEMIKKYQK